MNPIRITFGTAGLAGVFSACIDCFERCQFGRRLGEDFEIYLLRLEVAKLRMVRWGESMGFGTEPLSSEARSKLLAHPSTETENALRLLGEITAAFNKAEKSSKKFKAKAKNEDLVVYDTATDLEPGFRAVYTKFSSLTRMRQRAMGDMKVTRWALYERETCISLINNIKDHISDLVGLFPDVTQNRLRELCQTEISQIDSESLTALIEVVDNNDELLKEVAADAIEKRGEGHLFTDIKLDDFSRTQWGDNLGPNQQGRSHVFKGVEAKGNSVAHFGNTYSRFEGRTVFDAGQAADEMHN